jgi:hypothetical protein
MEHSDLKDFFWTPLFMVSGCSFLLFSGIIKLMNGPQVELFFRIGLIGMGIGFLCYLTRLIGRTSPKGKEFSSQESQTD